MHPYRLRLLLLSLVFVCGFGEFAQAKILLKNICRVKGQEENTLQGLGIVVGLNGTGDGGKFLPTTRSLATAMELMGNPVEGGLAELRETKNIALVSVTVTVPAAGARQGDKLDCTVASIGAAKSLEGGRLFVTPLQGPQKNNPRVYGFASGAIKIDGLQMARTGRIVGGCRLEEDFINPFVKDNKITLVLEESHADFQVAQDIAELINSQLGIQNGYQDLAVNLDQVNISVVIPPQYREVPGQFVAELLSMPILTPETEARVNINERAGSIVISGDVEIGAVVVSHKNLVIETGGLPQPDRFVPIEAGVNKSAQLKSLVDALNALKVPPADIIEIIKGLKRNGKLHGRLVIE